MVAEREGIPDEPHDISRQGMLMAAIGATAFSAVALQPLDNIRTRMMSAVERIADTETDLKALQDSKGGKNGVIAHSATKPHGHAAATRTMGKAAAQILATQGYRGFWKGTTATLASIVPFVAMSEALYDSLEKVYFDRSPPGHQGYVSRTDCLQGKP